MARRRRRKDEAPGWVWMLFGLGIGLIVALGVYLNGRQILPSTAVTAPALDRRQAAPPEQPAAQPIEAAPSQRRASEPAAQTETAAATTAAPPQRTAGEDPDRFSFYDLLPSFEVVIPEVESPAPRTEPLTAIAEPGVYVLQAGSFLTAADAETQRARLALLGVESRIQRVTIDDRAFHRVRIGPLEELDEVNAVRRRLADAQIESIVMRVAQ